MSVTAEHDFGKRVGGRLCLDFVNTVRGWVGADAGGGRDYADRVVGERLVSYGALLGWGRLAGILTAEEAAGLARRAARSGNEAAAVLERGLALRRALYRIFKAVIEGWTPEAGDLAVLNVELRVARAHERLVARPGLGFEWESKPGALDRVLWPVASSAAELLTGPELERVRQCPGGECGWLFVDTSRSRNRRWCDMADCGNVAKVRRFRERRGGRAARP